VWDRSGDRSHRDGFDECGRVLARFVEYDAARPIGQIDTGLLQQRCRGFEALIIDRENVVARRCEIGARLDRSALDRAEERDLWRAPVPRGRVL
jgi:hypothetical protein